MYLLEQYAQEKVQEFEEMKKVAKYSNEVRDIPKKELDSMLEAAFRLGHYVGHCRGELSTRKLNGLDVKEETQ